MRYVCAYEAPQTTRALTMNARTTRFSVPTSPVLIPSSMAIFASGAGASEAAVPATSATNTAMPRPRWGASSATSPRSLRPRPPVCRQRRRMSALVQCGRPVIARTALPYRRSSNGATSQARHRALARLAREEDLVGEPLLDDLAVEGRALQELVVRAMVQQSPALEHRD